MNRQQRKRLRLPDYNYAEYGCYFVTICTKDRNLLFGEIIDGEMQLNAIGELVQKALFSVLQEYPKVKYQAMLLCLTIYILFGLIEITFLYLL